MPIQLTTPYDPGDLDPGVVYDHATIVQVRWYPQAMMVTFHIEHGIYDGITWIPGRKPQEVIELRDEPKQGTTDYTDMLAKMPIPTLTTFESAWTEFLTYMLTEYPGIIVA